jgi:hypothetical protein
VGIFTNSADATPGDAMGEGLTVVRSGVSGLSWEIATL